MSKAGTVRPLELNREDAAVVSTLITERVTPGDALAGTPIAEVTTFGQRLRAAVERRRRGAEKLSIWNVPRSEALAGFHYLALLFRPDIAGLLERGEEAPVRAVCLELAAALTAKRGPVQLDRAEAEILVEGADRASPLEAQLEGLAAPDRRWVRRVRRRLKRDDALAAKPLNRIPERVVDMLTPNGKSVV